MKRRWIIPLVLVAFWGVMAFWLIRYEAFPGLFGSITPGYRGLFSRDMMVMDRWMLIRFNGVNVGYSHSQMDVDEESAARQILVENETIVRLKIMDQIQTIRVNTRATLDAMHHLQTFNFGLNTRGYFITLYGLRQREDLFRVTMRSNTGLQILNVHIPDDTVLYSPMTEMVLQKLEPGQSASLRFFNPVTMTSSDIPVKALRREPYRFMGTNIQATVVAATYQGMTVLSWVDPGGQILRQETPIGWIMEACTPEEAVARDDKEVPANDLLTALSIPCPTALAAPRQSKQLILRLRGPGLSEFVPPAPRRRILERKAEHLTVELSTLPETKPSPGAAPTPPPDPIFTNATPFIQADDPSIRRQAEKITAGLTNAWEAALALNNWVYKNVRKVPTVSLPSAADVLRQREGDCNEHTYLYVALARAAGLPAKVMVGVVYNEGAFYYHAWPAVFADGRWRELDPTFGQSIADATHVALLEGELADQMKLVGLLGRLQIDILSEDGRSTAMEKKP